MLIGREVTYVFSLEVCPVYFPSFKYALVSQSISLRLKLSYLWYGDGTGKNLTQFLQGLVLELLRTVFKVAYKRVRILA